MFDSDKKKKEKKHALKKGQVLQQTVLGKLCPHLQKNETRSLLTLYEIQEVEDVESLN